MKRHWVATFAALALLVTGCGGGGGSSGGAQPPLQALDQQSIVVQMDQNGDNQLDLITLDISESPFVILECLYGVAGGGFDDVTPFVRGLAIDPAVSGALATYVGDSFGEDRAELDVTNAQGDPTKVVVYGNCGGDANGATALAGDTLDVRPPCAAPGDAVFLRGSGFGDQPTVSFDETEAEILRFDDTRIICRVPEGLGVGEVTIHAPGADAGFHVLEAGAPVAVHMSAETATPGMLVFFIGARLDGAMAAFTQDDQVIDTAVLEGGSRVAYMNVPSNLPTGSYTVVLQNDAGDTGPCTFALDVVEPDEPTLVSIEPSERLPGQPILCKGTDLGPLGFCILNWTATDDGNDTLGFGFANGYDRVYTWVPGDARAGVTYHVSIEFSDGATTVNSVDYTVGTPPAPELTALEYDKGPPGSLLAIFGHGLVGGGYAWPTVLFTNKEGSTEAMIQYTYGGYHGAKGGGMGGSTPPNGGGPGVLQGGGFGGGTDQGLDAVVVEVPRELADGDYLITVTVSGQTSDGLPFEVGELALTVTSMRPDSQGPYGPMDVVVITGTGFGVPDWDFVIAGEGGGANGLALFDPGQDPFADIFHVTVTWERNGDVLEGQLLWYHDREILVIPPGGWEHPLPVGEYTVKVTVERDDQSTETVVAGTYTVHAKGGGGMFPMPGPGGMNR